MSRKPLISAIIIFRNAAPFLSESIESVFAQTCADWELLLADDGSSDGSTAIACSYANRYPAKVRYLEHGGHRNRGMSAARNLGASAASGEYLAFLDADDVWLPEKLARQAAILEANEDIGVVYCATQWWYSWTGNSEDVQRDFVHALGVARETVLRPPGLLPEFLRHEGISPCTCSVLVRRSLFESVGRFEERFSGLYEDQAFFAKACLVTNIFPMGECLARYRQRSDSASAVELTNGGHRAARLSFLKWLQSHLHKQRTRDRALWGTLRQEMWRAQHPSIYGWCVKAFKTPRIPRIIRANP
jgi:glycosyltransferase involved in cell wall biosynthesis